MMITGLLCSVLGVQAAVSRSADIKAVIEREMMQAAVPGLVYAVVEGDVIVASGARGVQRRGSDEPVDARTQFILGSISKCFTALAVMQLVEAGRIELEAPISKYLVEFHEQAAAPITVAQLLSHTSGYSTLQGNRFQSDLTMDDAALSRRVASLATLAPSEIPGDVWSYSNANYQILGRLVEEVSGRDFAGYVETTILVPAEMTDSYIHDGAPRATLAAGHHPWFASKASLPGNMTGRGSAPQGGVVSTAEDLARFLAIMMNGKDDILSAAGKLEMMRSAGPVSPRYGYGWFLNSEQGVVFHGGASPGYETLAMMLPGERKGVVVLVNGGSGLAFGRTHALRFGIANAALGIPYGGERPPVLSITGFVALMILPALLLFGMFMTWRKRAKLRARGGASAFIALGVPFVVALVFAWALLVAVPTAFGAPFPAIALFQPDSALVLAASAGSAVAWALLRILIWLNKP